jgi:hypothetical protein
VDFLENETIAAKRFKIGDGQGAAFLGQASSLPAPLPDRFD